MNERRNEERFSHYLSFSPKTTHAPLYLPTSGENIKGEEVYFKRAFKDARISLYLSCDKSHRY